MQFQITRFKKLDTPSGNVSKPEVKPGLGDRVAKIVRPIARGLDRVFGTHWLNCGGCEKRKEWLNKITEPIHK